MAGLVALQRQAWDSISMLSEAIQHAANPALPAAARATAGWPVMSLHAALGWCAAYGALVAYGLAVRPPRGPDGKRVSPKSAAVEAVVKPLMLAYNAAQVLLCGWMMAAVLVEAHAAGVAVSLSTLVCNPFRPAATGIARVLWVFYLSKILDFLDTVFFVVRGKWEQMSFLHVYHHFSIFLTYWLVTAVGYDGDVYYTVVANSFVHLVMYGYYFLSIIFPREGAGGARGGVGALVSFVGKYVTQLQMFQFVTMNAQAVYILANNCAYPHPVTYFYLVYILSLFGLFAQFYVRKWFGGKGNKKGAKTA